MSAASPVRVRFAPSPTGQLHVGNARTALFNWLFTRQMGGKLVLRIEDTDVERSEARYEDQIFEDLKWLGLDWDEGPDIGGPYTPYRQSERLEIYRRHAERLLDQGKAYLCFCTEEELQRERDRALAEHRSPIYSGKCRKLDPAEAKRRRTAGEACAIRLAIPERPIRFHDIVHGWVEFQHEVVSDPIILRSSGMPVYNYVVVIDDIEMKITLVIRGDDHLSNTPKQVALYEALGAPLPEFAHLSTILGADRERLSKRHGATSISNFRDMGILPEALMNYLALLGWAPPGGDREIFSSEELVKEFDLSRVTPSPAVFDFEKLYWLNRHYIKTTLSGKEIVATAVFLGRAGLLGDRVKQFADQLFAKPETRADTQEMLPQATGILLDAPLGKWLQGVGALLLPSVDRLDQLPERASLIFEYDARAALDFPENAEVLSWPKSTAVLEAFAKRAADDQQPMTADRFKAIMNEVKAETGAKGKELFHPVRVMLTGAHSGPEFDKLIPIIEDGSRLELPRHVKSVRERVQEFMAARG